MKKTPRPRTDERKRLRTPRDRICDSVLTDSERDYIKNLGPTIKSCAAILGVGFETFKALSDPFGYSTPRTIQRIKERIHELKSQGSLEERTTETT